MNDMHSTILLLLTALPFWQDMDVTSVNAETRRTEVIYYADRADALQKGFRESENYLSLNGEWDFRYFEDHRAMEKAFAGTQQGGQWDKVRVPGNWEVQGYGTAIYTNIPYDFCPRDPQPPQLPESVPAALYRRSFTVPETWQGREVYLNLCGSKSGTYVYVNGQEIGYSEDSKSLARFRITPALKKGENQLTLKIYRYSTASFLEDQDFWRLSGLERDVYLSSEKTDTGFDFSVISTLTPDLRTGVFKLKMRSHAPAEVFYELIDQDGDTVADAIFEFCGEMATVTDSIPQVRKWSAETPELYTLLLRVNGEYTRFHVGFRRIEMQSVKDGDRDVKALLVNGQPVKFKGVNLHEHNPYTGHYVTRENLLEDLRLMRQANINAIRTCHYPQSREFYELCDSLGFYVYDEANVESHAMGYRLSQTLGNKPEWYGKHIDRILNMYARTANYPCVTILSLGNEAGNGVNFYNAYRELKKLEKDGQNRPVVYERAEYEWNTDMIVPQYPGADWFRKMGETYKDRPVCPSEYAHAMGNSTGSLDLQWEAIYAHPHLQGGFIWDWVDQGLYDAERGWTYGGDYGENAPSDNNFLCNGLVNPDRDPHPGYFEVKHVYQDIEVRAVDASKGLFEVFNRHYFTSLEDYQLTWRVERDGKVLRKGKCQLSAAPQAAEPLKIKLPRLRKNGEYRILFEVKARRELPLVAKGSIVAVDDILLKEAAPRKAHKSRGRLNVHESGSRVPVGNKKVEVVFDQNDGILKEWRVKGKDLLDPAFGLRPNFWRAPNDNDYGCGEPRRAQAYKTLSAQLPAPEMDLQELHGGAVEVVFRREGVLALQRFTVYPDGVVTVACETAPAPKLKNVEIPRLGFRFRLDDERFSYLGRGPVENYWDRNSGTFRSIWQSTASAEYYPYVRPQETGHHTDAAWLQLNGFTVVQTDGPFEFSVLRQRVEDLDGEDAVGRPYQWPNYSPDDPKDEDAARNVLRRQTHLNDVPVQPFTEVCLDYHMTGVGGYDSWGARPEKERTLWSDRSYTYGFALVPRKAKKAAKYSY